MARFRSAYSDARPLIRGRRLERVGVRFQDRIDIPDAGDGQIQHNDYLNVGIKDLPFSYRTVNTQLMNVDAVLNDTFGVLINCGRVLPPPLIDQISLLLDIDVYARGQLPRTERELWALLEEMRDLKNTIFESCITDKTRELLG